MKKGILALLAIGLPMIASGTRGTAPPPTALTLARIPQPASPRTIACRKEAEAGDRNAQAELGSMFYLGEGVERDSRQAAQWFLKAAQAGDVRAQAVLAMLLEEGDGVARNPAEALRWYIKAAEGGDPDAQVRLADHLVRGEGIDRNPTQARAWLERAAQGGSVAALTKLGALCILEGGKPEEAARWFKMAADQGDAEARSCLDTLQALMAPR